MSTNHGENGRRTAWVVGGAELAGRAMTGKSQTVCSPCGFGDTANKQVVLAAYGAPDGECDDKISALNLVTNLF